MKEFAKRRHFLMNMLGEDGIAIIPSAREIIRNRDVHFRFRQDSDFHYLTGFNEPDSVLVLVPGRQAGEVVMFCRERDAEKELWDGRRAGLEGVISHYGADDAFPIDDIDEILPGLIENREKVFYAMGRDADFDRRLMGWVNQIKKNIRSGVHAPNEFISLEHVLHEMRLIKDAAELKLMRRACQVTAEAHVRAMQICQPGMMEYELQAEIEYHFAKANMTTAYASIVGGGINGCILHYTENQDKLRAKDLVLIDAGAEHQGYAADITRTFPVSGKFSPAQRDIYQLVLDAQYAAIEQVKPGAHWNDPHDAVVRVLSQGLLDLQLLQGSLDEVMERQLYRRFFMHRTGHWLGRDVHDVGDYKVDDQWRMLEAGMVLTIEPGLYLDDREDVPKAFRGIGIRIEDDVAVSKDGVEVLTAAVAKEIDDIEMIMAHG